MPRTLLGTLALPILLAACAGDSAHVVWTRGEAAAQLVGEQARALPADAPLRLGDITPFRWERLYLLPPGTPSPALLDSLGPAWPPLAGSAPAGRAGEPRLVFLAGGTVIAAGALPPGAVEVAPELLGRGYAPAEAAFRVERAPGRVPRLAPRPMP